MTATATEVERLVSLPAIASRAGCSCQALYRLLRQDRGLEPTNRAFGGGPRLFSAAEADALVRALEAHRARVTTPAT